MKLHSFFTLLTLTIASYGFAAEEAVIQLKPHTPVVYHSNVKMTAQQKTTSGLKDIGKGTMQFSGIVNVKSDKKPYEFLASPKTFNFELNVGGLTVSYDTELALKTNSIAQERTFIQTVIDHTFHIPLTTDPSVGDPNDFYVLRVFNDPDNKMGSEKELTEIVQAIDGGISYKIGQKEEFDLDTNVVWDKGHVVRTVTHVDENKVIVKEEITFVANSFVNGENPEDGGFAIQAHGEFEKVIQRSNWLLMTCEGSLIVEVSEMPGPDGKKNLADGDLIINIHGNSTSSLPNPEVKFINTPFVQEG